MLNPSESAWFMTKLTITWTKYWFESNLVIFGCYVNVKLHDISDITGYNLDKSLMHVFSDSGYNSIQMIVCFPAFFVSYWYDLSFCSNVMFPRSLFVPWGGIYASWTFLYLPHQCPWSRGNSAKISNNCDILLKENLNTSLMFIDQSQCIYIKHEQVSHSLEILTTSGMFSCHELFLLKSLTLQCIPPKALQWTTFPMLI